MFGKVKKWLGIEGAKIELVLPREIFESAGNIVGKVRFRSMNEQKVLSINLKLIEKYSRGRQKSRLVDEYTIGEIDLTNPFLIPVGELVEIDQPIKLSLRKKHNIEVVVDRIKVKNDLRQRLAESFETALRLTEGLVHIAFMEGNRKDLVFSSK